MVSKFLVFHFGPLHSHQLTSPYTLKSEMSKLPWDVNALLYSKLLALFSSKVLRLCIALIFNPHIAIFFKT
jgi:hypothetical protein